MPRWYDWVTKIVSAKTITERLVNRFGLQQNPLRPQEDYILRKWIIPITDVDELLKTAKILDNTFDLSVSTSTQVTILECATNKRIKLKAIYRDSCTANTQMSITDGTGRYRITDVATVAFRTYVIDLPLLPGWKLESRGTNNAGDSAVLHEVIYEEEDAY